MSPLVPEFTQLPTGDVGHLYYHGVYYHDPEGAVLGKSGALWIGRQLVERLGGRGKRVVPYAVPEKKMVAFRIADSRQWGLKMSVGQNSGAHISAAGIVKAMGLALPDEPTFLSARVDDGWLIVDLEPIPVALAKYRGVGDIRHRKEDDDE